MLRYHEDIQVFGIGDNLIKLIIGKPIKLQPNEIDIILVDKETRELYHEIMPLLDCNNLDFIKRLIKEVINDTFLFKYAVTNDKMYIPDETGILKVYNRNMK